MITGESRDLYQQQPERSSNRKVHKLAEMAVADERAAMQMDDRDHAVDGRCVGEILVDGQQGDAQSNESNHGEQSHDASSITIDINRNKKDRGNGSHENKL